jgi:hypothetical protein
MVSSFLSIRQDTTPRLTLVSYPYCNTTLVTVSGLEVGGQEANLLSWALT